MVQKQHFRGVFIKSMQQNMQQIYRKTPCQSVIQLQWNCSSAWVFSCKFAAYFQNTFLNEYLWRGTSDALKMGTSKFLSSIFSSDCTKWPVKQLDPPLQRLISIRTNNFSYKKYSYRKSNSYLDLNFDLNF